MDEWMVSEAEEISITEALQKAQRRANQLGEPVMVHRNLLTLRASSGVLDNQRGDYIEIVRPRWDEKHFCKACGRDYA